MVTQFNPNDMVKFGNYVASLIEIGMKQPNDAITKEDFENWKVGEDISNKHVITEKCLVEFFEVLKHGCNPSMTDFINISVTGDSGDKIHFVLSNTYGSEKHFTIQKDRMIFDGENKTQFLFHISNEEEDIHVIFRGETAKRARIQWNAAKKSDSEFCIGSINIHTDFDCWRQDHTK